ncbi:MAG TPA: S8 family serine peptidase [Gemmatimonadaceae bacterium]|nr:S8 family serine peptidase [Gemmatimonadaceae bacterium]
MRRFVIGGILASAAVMGACSDAAPTSPSAAHSLNVNASLRTRHYIVVANANTIPSSLSDQVAKYGGTITASLPQIGIAFVSAPSEAVATNASQLSGVQSVIPDLDVKWTPGVQGRAAVPEPAAADATPNVVIAEPFQFLQWNLQAVHAQQAWNAGDFGQGATVYILDSGIDCTHPDLTPNLDIQASTSFVPGETACITPGFYFNHGTHVAGIIAAAANGLGVVGVAPQTHIVAVKVLSETSESGPFSGIIEGIVYAADHHADIINMSLISPPLPRSGFVDAAGNVATARDITELVNAVNRATTYANQKGSTVIVAAGNDGLNRNHDSNATIVPADDPDVLSIAATGPVGWAVDPGTDLDVPAQFSNSGQSRIDFAAPGGTDTFLTEHPDAVCAVGFVEPCFVFDWVFSTIAGGWGWATGTSMAAPHASAVAALLVTRYGHMTPAQLGARLRASAVDLGKPGKDAFFGQGFLDAGRAVQ